MNANLAEADRLSKTKSKRGLRGAKLSVERYKAAIEPARNYWAEVDRIKAESGIEQAQDVQKQAKSALEAIVSQIMAFEESTIEGLVIKAQAISI